MKNFGFFVASTGQNIGKTTLCLGLLEGLKKRIGRVGFMKPVGQEHVETETGVHVDKDVLLFKDHFNLSESYEEMSPVLFPSGFTRDYLDEKISEDSLRKKILTSFQKITKKNHFVLIEGTGHVGVGSIVNLNNAQVASLLSVPLVLISSGGLGSAFDELTLNKTLCDKYGVKVLGVILNRVIDEKKEMIISYMEKALTRWNIPLLGCIPYDPFLSNPTMKDFELLFNSTLLTGEEHRLRHFKHIRLVATSVEIYKELILPHQLIITPADREDIILSTLKKHQELKAQKYPEGLDAGCILTGDRPPRAFIIKELQAARIPMLYIPMHSYSVMKMITTFTAKIRKEDLEKIKEAIQVVESHINFPLLFSLLGHSAIS